ncbi:MAG: glycosyltransferase family 4 protein [Acidimicrobiia bacterium]
MSSDLKVLLSAYACEPHKGSEPEVGLRTALAVAREHEVWVITRTNNLDPLRRFLEDHPLATRIHLVGIDLSHRALRAKRRLGILGMHWYYDAWQRQTGRVARDLDRQVGFDLVHHVTFASHWTRAGVAQVDKPLIWGPVGGGVDPVWSLLPALGARGVVQDAIRSSVRVLARGLSRKARQKARVIFAQNRETARRLTGISGRVQILPNATAVSMEMPSGVRVRSRDVVFAGNLIPLKGARLAIQAFRSLRRDDAKLRIFGDGPERSRLEAIKSALGLDSQVYIEGRVHRDELIRVIAGSAVLVHPAIHDEAGLVVAEALSVGTPVVCLDRGGPAEIAARWPTALSRRVSPSSSTSRTARRIASAIEVFLESPPPIPQRPISPLTDFGSEILSAYEEAVSVGRTGGASRL